MKHPTTYRKTIQIGKQMEEDISSRGAIGAVASRLAPIGRAICNNYFLIVAALFLAMAFLPEPVSARINDLVLGSFALVAWACDRDAQAWRRRCGIWQAAAASALELIPQRSMSWSDFCARVEVNMPDDQREAVRYALELAVAPELPGTAH